MQRLAALARLTEETNTAITTKTSFAPHFYPMLNDLMINLYEIMDPDSINVIQFDITSV